MSRLDGEKQRYDIDNHDGNKSHDRQTRIGGID